MLGHVHTCTQAQKKHVEGMTKDWAKYRSFQQTKQKQMQRQPLTRLREQRRGEEAGIPCVEGPACLPACLAPTPAGFPSLWKLYSASRVWKFPLHFPTLEEREY